MYELINLPLCGSSLAEYGGGEALRRELAAMGCDGIEGLWAMSPIPGDIPGGLVVGYHLTFFTDWLDLYREDKAALVEKYGTLEAARGFYGGLGAEYMMRVYRDDLRRAQGLGARYIVFHVSDVSIEEGYTYRWRHSHQEVVDAAVETVNALLPGGDQGFDLLLENLWWPGFTMTDPALTARMLDGVRYPRKGIMLDTGHLMNTNTALATQQEGAAYIHRMLDAHGGLCRYIRGLHLHQSLSGAYVRGLAGGMPPDMPRDPGKRFAVNYGHILQIDQHRPWTVPEAASIVERVRPEYLTHELSAGSPGARRRAVLAQRRALGFPEGRPQSRP